MVFGAAPVCLPCVETQTIPVLAQVWQGLSTDQLTSVPNTRKLLLLLRLRPSPPRTVGDWIKIQATSTRPVYDATEVRRFLSMQDRDEPTLSVRVRPGSDLQADEPYSSKA